MSDERRSDERQGPRLGDEMRENQMKPTAASEVRAQRSERLRRVTAVVAGAFASRRGGVAFAAVSAFLIAVFRAPAVFFIYDAGVYWVAAVAATSGGDFFELGGLLIRGALTAFIYVPAALLAMLFGPESGLVAVLIQNSLLIAIIGAVLIPALVRLFVMVPPLIVYASAIGTALLLGGLAPYPLVDLWALSLVLFAIVLVGRTPNSWVRLGVAGLLLGAAFNLRPAYLVPVILIALAWVVASRLRVLATVGGFALALVPQVVVNLMSRGSWAPWPVNAFVVTDVQTKYAGFIVRYDTLAYAPDASAAQLFYCNPGMATRFVSGTPGSMGELALSFVEHLPVSLKFVAQKVAASLHWTSQTPYSGYPSDELSALTLAVVAVSSAGFLGLIWFVLRRREGRSLTLTRMAPVFALWAGTSATLAFATPEARFALPVLVLGIVGCLVVGCSRPAVFAPSGRGILFIAGAVLLAAGLLWIGQSGLAHPADLGDATARICSAS